LRDSWGLFWQKIAQEFKDEPNVLGLELINEPWCGNHIKDPILLVPGVGDKKFLQPTYDFLAEKIWQIDNDRLVFFAGVTWDDFMPSGFEHAPNRNQNNSVFAFHYYKPPQLGLEYYFERRMMDAKRLNTGAMLTEFDGGNFDNQKDNYEPAV